MATINDEMRRAILAYVAATYPEFTGASLNDCVHRYYEMKIGQIGLNRTLNELQRTYWGATSEESINDAERRFYVELGGNPSKSLNDLELEYWIAQ